MNSYYIIDLGYFMFASVNLYKENYLFHIIWTTIAVVVAFVGYQK